MTGLVAAVLTVACSTDSTSAPPSLEPSTTTAVEQPATPEATGVDDPPTDHDPPIDPTTEEPLLLGELSMQIVATHPHDPDAFTQGLEVTDDGRLLESTGLYGASDRRIVDVESGTVELIDRLPSDLFGEGVTIVDDELIQITWREGIYLRADADTLIETGRGTYDGEGWGLCHDGEQLVMSDGTPTLVFRDPRTFDPLGSVEVTSDGGPVTNLNELECVNGQVLANIWLSDIIVVIDPATGMVVATLDGSPLRPTGLSTEDSRFALNGIAHDPSTGRYFITGKWWPVLYEVEIS